MLTGKYHSLISKPHPFLHIWVNSLVIGGLTFSFTLWYIIVTSDTSSFLRILNQAAAETSIILISLSFAMSSVVYFWDFADHYLLYRKYWGLIGFYFALYHGIYTLYRMIPRAGGISKLFEWPVLGLSGDDLLAFIFALISLFILAVMAAISNVWATKILGGRLWRFLLRAGYLALLLGGLHSGLKTYENWQEWFQTYDPILPPLSLLTSLLIIAVFLLRLLLQLSINKKKHVPFDY